MAEIAILSVGTGDTKLVFDPNNPEDSARAAKTIADMLKRGYCILVEAGKDDRNEPLYRRVKQFDEKTHEYIIAGDPPDLVEGVKHEQSSGEAQSGEDASQRRAKSKPIGGSRRIHASRASGVAIAPIAGG